MSSFIFPFSSLYKRIAKANIMFHGLVFSFWKISLHSILSIFSACFFFSGLCPDTTNAVESMNKISVPAKSVSFKAFLEHLYRVERGVGNQTVARQQV